MPTQHVLKLKQHLVEVSTPEKAQSAKRYFPYGINCIGANAADIKHIIKQFHLENATLSAEQALAITEALLKQAEYSEEVMLAYGLITKFVKKHYDDSLLDRFKFWLEHYANNWALVDDLCMKTLFQFLMARPHLIEQTQKWAYSDVSWCRRASNVAWVKFIHRKIGKTVYQLDKKLVFKNCDLLLEDKDEFVQKSVGWLLKVTAVHHQDDVLLYLEKNHQSMPRATIRYALEKVPKPTREQFMRDYR
ncbi:DNA alkylation repair protein [Paraglaciecola aquimarina]|uniref:DNA alkylation repair protein n=1 Tax=Paraglaciecola algarum TaxID=3050085 RepID=A0ABS9D8D8_9ALTE|nr:DNA alkylation repair protein [Paraglaciecola sp. G1-23]MCF2948262.1 DNA alkylation repair protein [Paraglaciecola sp. G1-23]